MPYAYWKEDNNDLQIREERYCVPLQEAWGVTIHSVQVCVTLHVLGVVSAIGQGMSIERLVVHCHASMAYRPGMFYVAVSRCPLV